jgi:hypothetical protein
MEDYWCSKKNTMLEMLKDPENYNPALIPRPKAECDPWDKGECFYVCKAGK